MTDSGSGWAEPRWIELKKHRPPPNVPWPEVVESTKRPSPARYAPQISREIQELLEIECVTNGNLLSETRHKKAYYMKRSRMIGASGGVETEWIYAERLRTGVVHGRPISETELRKKGAAI